MIRVRMFSDDFTSDVASDVASFLNNTNGIQIIDISWFTKSTKTVCVITYMEV